MPTEGPCSVLRCGQILDYVSPNQYGALAYLWSTGTLAEVASATHIAAGSTTYNLFDAMTGNYILSIVNGSSFADSLTEDEHGDLIGYYTNYTNPNAPTLSLWNSTIAILYPNGYIPGVTAITWSLRPLPAGAIIPFSSGIMWTVPLPTNISGSPLLGIDNITPTQFGVTAVDSGVVFLRAPTGGFFNDGFMYEAGYDMDAGAQLWFVNRTEPPYTLIASSGGSIYSGDGVFIEIPQGALLMNCYSLATGKLL